MEMTAKKEQGILLRQLERAGWIVFVALLVITFVILTLIMGDSVYSLVMLITIGKTQQATLLQNDMGIFWLQKLIFTVAAFATIGLIYNAMQGASRNTRGERFGTLVRVMCVMLIITVVGFWLPFVVESYQPAQATAYQSSAGTLVGIFPLGNILSMVV